MVSPGNMSHGRFMPFMVILIKASLSSKMNRYARWLEVCLDPRSIASDVCGFFLECGIKSPDLDFESDWMRAQYKAIYNNPRAYF